MPKVTEVRYKFRYVDSNIARDFDKRRSLTGYVFTIGGFVLVGRLFYKQ